MQTPTAKQTHSRDYEAKNLLVLEGLEAVRKRPAMYIGSTDTRGLMHCLWEIIDNAVDEALSGFGTRIAVSLNHDGSITVVDKARGIPVDTEPRTGLSGVEVVFTKLHAGGKFGNSSYNATGGLHGVGASVVNALSSRLDVEVDRDGATWAMSFRRGTPGVFDGEGPDAPFTPGGGLRKVGRVRSRAVTGTRVTYWPDRQIFLTDAQLSVTQLHDRARQTSFLVPGLELEVTDARGDEAATESFLHEGGIAEFADFLAADAPLTDIIRLQGTDSFVETVPMLDDAGAMTATDVERQLEVDIAVRWGTGYDTVVRSFVNIIATPKGGTHVTGFERGLTKAIVKSFEGTRGLLKAGEEVIKEDCLEGITAVVTVRLAEPQFEGQTKEVLGTPPVRAIVARIVESELTAFMNAPKTKAVARQLQEKVVGAARTRVQARNHKENQRRKNALESSTLPPKLKDCRSNNVDLTELFIVEGDSALGTANVARDSEHQALLPIRGKILNVQKASVGDMLKNAECAAIIQVVGAGSGRTFDVDNARYGKIIFMADADSDGAHIRCLLATLFFRYMRPMVEAGRVYSAVPPLHRFELTNPRKGQEKYIYTYSDAEYQRKLAELTRRGTRFKEPQRYKGLGEMDAHQLADTTMSPKHRTLRRLTVDDALAAERVFEMLMGNDVAPRKEFIIEGAYQLDAERIDA
ncbi:DNA gyrase/topoisomerase IV subunit B [Tessaracoccus lacteus]|uniref:DNA topoisomerase (ATP-hydrolyzing) n=1 Tax=Tessaracoccus lacteus TaxID=3041766 RepID=A0ABY8Q0M5_9ACTN|nr:DNA topoisomerase IV subunit B [Tessaracoccus sp. T21]WGT48366.1 DNA topoisomerase IV subunit B [Tessaracoccus sp. T21]